MPPISQQEDYSYFVNIQMYKKNPFRLLKLIMSLQMQVKRFCKEKTILNFNGMYVNKISKQSCNFPI